MNKKVLIIEDDRSLAESLKAVFSRKKLSVKISHSVQQAENLISLEQYDLLVVDVVLPKVSGIDFLRKIISKGLLHSRCKIWLISGVLSKKIISKDMVSHVDMFLKKPLNMKVLEKKIDTLFVPSDNLPKNIKFFYLDYTDKKNVLKNEEHLIKGHEFMFICFYLCSIRFNGVLSVSYYGTEGKKDEVLLKDGNITSFKSINERSYIRPLLIKHNLVAKKDIDKLLKEKSDTSLSERLIDGCYVSPHKMDRILKEQLAIRLFEIMEHPSLVVSCSDFVSSMNFSRFISLEMRNFLSLVYNWIHSKVSVEWLRAFFSSHREMRVKILKKLSSGQRLSHYAGLEFLSSDSIKETKTVESIISESDKEEEDILRELYCRLLVRENCFEYKSVGSVSTKDHVFIRRKYQEFLNEAKTKNYFEVLNLPLNAPVYEIEEAYRNIVKIFHPDRRDSNLPSDLSEICDRCFILIREIYQTLSDQDKKQAYLKKLEKKSRMGQFEVREAYIKGKSNVESGHYNKAVSQLKFVLQHKEAPGDTPLYYIWSVIQSKQFVIDKEDINKTADLFDSVSLDHRQSALFFFTKGLFMKAKGERRTAFNLFTQALRLDPRLSVARLEKYSLSISRRKGKKSLMSLFKKGA